jgi:hypothetical protein
LPSAHFDIVAKMPEDQSLALGDNGLEVRRMSMSGWRPL